MAKWLGREWCICTYQLGSFSRNPSSIWVWRPIMISEIHMDYRIFEGAGGSFFTLPSIASTSLDDPLTDTEFEVYIHVRIFGNVVSLIKPVINHMVWGWIDRKWIIWDRAAAASAWHDRGCRRQPRCRYCASYTMSFTWLSFLQQLSSSLIHFLSPLNLAYIDYNIFHPHCCFPVRSSLCAVIKFHCCLHSSYA